MTNVTQSHGSSPASRGGAGVYIEGELGAFYLLALLIGTEARGLPGARLTEITFQGADSGYALDDLILHGVGPSGPCLLEIQSKRDVTFAPKDATFADIAAQVARSGREDIPEEHHHLAAATQRTSHAISGPYQDVLLWSRSAETGAAFFARLAAEGVANDKMRQFVQTFRSHLVAGGVLDDDEAMWRFLRRFQILEFDFEATSSQARAHALMLARLALADEDVPRAEGLWSSLIELSLATGRMGGTLDRDALHAEVQDRGFRLAGDRDHRPARAALRETARRTLENIGTTVAGAHLPRHAAIHATGEALDAGRFALLTGDAGVGKSAVLRAVAERIAREATLIVLDADATPPGGWIEFARRFGIQGPAGAFLMDVAVSGGGLICIDGIDMIIDPARQRTVNELLREAGRIEGFRFIASARANPEGQIADWLNDDVLDRFGTPRAIAVGDLTDAEVGVMSDAAPHLRPLLAADAPAAPIARNLHRLSRLARLTDPAAIRTEARLARHWWSRADDAPRPAVRPAQRILADLARTALAGGQDIEFTEDGEARAHLLGRRTLREVRRDRVDFQHDVLRDWAIGAWIGEDIARLSDVDVSQPPSPRVLRGVEFAGRMILEEQSDANAWSRLLDALAKPDANGAWRRAALLAIVRSEAASALLEQTTPILLEEGGALLRELIVAIRAVETIAAHEVLEKKLPIDIPPSMRIGRGGYGLSILQWAGRHRAEIPLEAIASIIDLVETEALLLIFVPALARPVAEMLFNWLLQLDVRTPALMIPRHLDASRRSARDHDTMIGDLRTTALLLAQHAPDLAKTYLREVAHENDTFKFRTILKASNALATVAPAELAALVVIGLRRTGRNGDRNGHRPRSAFSYADSDYLPESPAQPPFLQLLTGAPTIGLQLVRGLVGAAVAFGSSGKAPTPEDGFTIIFDDGPRFFPWRQTYFWSRGQGREHAVGSALLALEAWGHQRLEANEPVEDVLCDVLGPPGSCAAFLLVAVDLLLSHWPHTREAMVPFLTDPALLAMERQRSAHEPFGQDTALATHNEPNARPTLADLVKRPSRRSRLEDMIQQYLKDETLGGILRERLVEAVAAIGPYDESDDFGTPAFMGAHALNLLDPNNWVKVDEGMLAYQPPAAEADHLARLSAERDSVTQHAAIEARIHMAIRGGDQATPQMARDAVAYAAGALPDGNETDVLKARSTRLAETALLVACDGDDELLAEHEGWVRDVVDRTLALAADGRASPHETLDHNQSAIAILTLIHLWRRNGAAEDRNALVEMAARHKGDAWIAFAAGCDAIVAKDDRVLKAVMRAALSACVYRWRPFGEDDAIQVEFTEKLATTVVQAVAAEVAWLDGAAEPEWPALPEEYGRRRHGIRIPTVHGRADDEAEEDPTPYDPHGGVVRADASVAAKWLDVHGGTLTDAARWDDEIVAAYGAWTARRNGADFDTRSRTEAWHDTWNDAFYMRLAHVLMNASDERFEAELKHVMALPDDAFARAVGIIARATDALYFNDASRPATRIVALRRRLAERAMSSGSWRLDHSPGSLSIDMETRSLVATLLFNEWHILQGTTASYLVPNVADRIDPLLDTVLSLQSGGRTPYVAHCTMNALLVLPRARHLGFLLDAAEAWHARLPGHDGLWNGMGVGQKIIEWFAAAIEETPELLDPNHSERSRIDRLLDRLVNVGVARAHDLALRMQAGPATS